MSEHESELPEGVVRRHVEFDRAVDNARDKTAAAEQWARDNQAALAHFLELMRATGNPGARRWKTGFWRSNVIKGWHIGVFDPGYGYRRWYVASTDGQFYPYAQSVRPSQPEPIRNPGAREALAELVAKHS